mmetsp:Transcript_37407/g.105623  ORF Transcript_37407/g.105623 Transcript_37407/m.105623 type:complete len:359 (+) Transcript_37407:94-1170(+)
MVLLVMAVPAALSKRGGEERIERSELKEMRETALTFSPSPVSLVSPGSSPIPQCPKLAEGDRATMADTSWPPPGRRRRARSREGRELPIPEHRVVRLAEGRRGAALPGGHGLARDRVGDALGAGVARGDEVAVGGEGAERVRQAVAARAGPDDPGPVLEHAAPSEGHRQRVDPGVPEALVRGQPLGERAPRLAGVVGAEVRQDPLLPARVEDPLHVVGHERLSSPVVVPLLLAARGAPGPELERVHEGEQVVAGGRLEGPADRLAALGELLHVGGRGADVPRRNAGGERVVGEALGQGSGDHLPDVIPAGRGRDRGDLVVHPAQVERHVEPDRLNGPPLRGLAARLHDQVIVGVLVPR